MPTSRRLLERQDVRLGNVPYIYPVEGASLGKGVALLPLALYEGDEPRIGSVDARKAGKVVHHGAEDQWWVDGDEVELDAAGLVVDKGPGRLLGELLGGPVRGSRILVDVVDGHGVPRLLGEGGVGVTGLGHVEDRGERRGHHDSLDAWGGLCDGPEDARGADDGRVDQVLLGVGNVEVEGGGRVEDGLETRGLDDLVEGVRLGDIRHDDGLQAVLSQAGVGGVDSLCFFLGPDSGDNLVAPFEQLLEDVSGDEAGTTCSLVFSKSGFILRVLSPQDIPVSRTLVIFEYSAQTEWVSCMCISEGSVMVDAGLFRL